jgi:AP-3 complex subunit sigma
LAEIIQGGLVLETNIEEIDNASTCLSSFKQLADADHVAVQQTTKLRRESFASANPLSLGVGGGLSGRGGNLKTPLGWLTGKLTGVNAR